MSWKSSADGTWRKELGGVEKIYRFQSTIFRGTGREHWGLYTVCQVKLAAILNSDDIIAALCNAWKALRFEFPALTLIVDGYEAVYTDVVEEDGIGVQSAVEDWAKKTFLVEPLLTMEELLADYKLHDLPELIWLPATSQIVLRVSHWRVDGIGTCMLLNRLFNLISTKAADVIPGDWSIEKDLAKISPSLEDAAGSPMASNQEIENTAREISTTFREKALQSIGLPYNGDRTTPPGQAAVQATTFTTETSKALVAECKARKISVTAAIHAALAAATFELTSAKGVDEYVTIMAVSYRPYLKEPYNSEAHACQTYVSSIAPTVSKNASFDQQTTTLTELFKNWNCEKMSHALRELYHGASQALLSPPPCSAGPLPNPPSGITHSNLGVIDNFIKCRYYDNKESELLEKTPIVEVNRFRFGVSILTRQMLLYPWTFRGQLNLSINYNDAYYDADTPHKVLDLVQQKLEEELHLKLERLCILEKNIDYNTIDTIGS
ncbi:conserved hypothetical protein [Talaromyces stipitatus ATCC 10500]|uniref:Condensation domain-containing protein n=1 Tax=Talaromyces stipitatus (strain ATCC 10500 / CBS 375.48 / QM 6759 / NRRL 1006) TaxID=441959 RepID=B8LX31_TALSN|nr:uncharacterized protein TSTA_061690 [Talaromyces stipitatus ATCC 10500]EED22681.1 conserved hypothetical protein [Talaromyces stipitatus ATCC 10500]